MQMPAASCHMQPASWVHLFWLIMSRACIVKIPLLPPPFLQVDGPDPLSREAQRNATLLFLSHMRATFAAKRVLREYRLTREAFDWVLGEIEQRFSTVRVLPGTWASCSSLGLLLCPPHDACIPPGGGWHAPCEHLVAVPVCAWAEPAGVCNCGWPACLHAYEQAAAHGAACLCGRKRYLALACAWWGTLVDMRNRDAICKGMLHKLPLLVVMRVQCLLPSDVHYQGISTFGG